MEPRVEAPSKQPARAAEFLESLLAVRVINRYLESADGVSVLSRPTTLRRALPKDGLKALHKTVHTPEPEAPVRL